MIKINKTYSPCWQAGLFLVGTMMATIVREFSGGFDRRQRH